MAQGTALETKKLTKTFPGVRALHEVDFAVRRGEVHVLLGENGAGKSTLVKILTGVYHPDSGECLVEGRPVHITSPIVSFQMGIAAIYQELSLLPHLDVATNIFLGKLPLKRGGIIDKKRLYAEAQAVLASLEASVDPKAVVASLGFGKRQLVEIAKALAANARILFMDEPTSALDIDDRDHLFKIIRELKAKGLSIVYISHKLEEVGIIGDRVTVLRDGQKVITGDVKAFTVEDLIRHMVGRGLMQQVLKEQAAIGKEVDLGEVVFEVRNLNRAGVLRDVSFSLRKGEILGVAGLVGAGRTEMANCIFGVDPYESGEILVEGTPVKIRSPQDAIRHGIAMLTEDRKTTGVVGMMSVADNITIPLVNSDMADNCTKLGVVQTGAQVKVATQYVDRLRIRTPSVQQLVNNLSGGNQQKVILAKWLALRSKIVIFDEPTRGIDVGAKNEIYLLMDQLLREGISIIMISSELPELLALSDRIIVLSGGRISGEFKRNETDQEGIMACAVKYT